jgi:hypothetical protein
VKAAALLSPQEPCEEVVERLEEILLEIGRLPLPPGSAGSSLLDTFEIMDRARKRARTAAKAMLVKEPSALPGWRVAVPNGRRNPNAGLEWARRGPGAGTSLKLVKRRTAGSALRKTSKKGNQTTP